MVKKRFAEWRNVIIGTCKRRLRRPKGAQMIKNGNPPMADIHSFLSFVLYYELSYDA